MIKLSLLPQYFDLIKAGVKTVEGRLNTEKFATLKKGEKIVFNKNSTDENVVCLVIGCNKYNDFQSMLLAEGIDQMLPGITSIEQAVQIYENLPGYKDKVKIYGALAIKIKII